MQFLIIIPMLCHLLLIRKHRRRCLIHGAVALLLLAGVLCVPGSYLPAGILMLCLILDAPRAYALYGVLLLFMAVTWQLAHGLPCWIAVYLAFVWHNDAMHHSHERQMLDYQNKVLERQVREVENMFTTMRGWRHDYHNHLQNLKAKLKKGELEASLGYLDALEKELDEIRQLVESGNANMDAILNSKLSLALKQGIALSVKAKVPSRIPVSDTDICALLGNLVDNAVEACEKVPKDRFLRLYIGKYKGQLYISCTNATSEVVRRLDEDYVSRKRGNHGHGLKRMNQVVEKYGGTITRRNEPGVFITEILLPL